MFLKWRRTHGGVQLNLNRSHSYDSSRQRKDHIHGRLCYFPQGGFEQFLFRLFPNGDVVWNFTHATMVSVMYACVWIATLPVRQQKSQSFCPNPWQIWIHSTSLRCNRALWVIIDSAIPAVHQHFLASRSLCQRWNWKQFQFHWVSRCERCFSSPKATGIFQPFSASISFVLIHLDDPSLNLRKAGYHVP